MSYTIFTDGCSNLPGRILKELDIQVLPCNYVLDGEHGIFEGDIDSFSSHSYYEKLRNGSQMKTSLLNTQLFLDHFRPELEKGQDIIYVGLSSGVSGTFQSAHLASIELSEEYPARKIIPIDSLGASLGTGLITCRAADLRKEGKSAEEAAEILNREVMQLLQFFTVDDLSFLKRTGRISGTTASVGTMLNIKPILWGDETGHIVSWSKVRGRKKAIDTLAELYRTKAVHPENQRIAISHGDCPEDAERLAQKIREIYQPKELIICPHEPFTGSHVGPGMLALYFFGEYRR